MQAYKKRYFAAANTPDGFISYYDNVFGDLKKIYVIKGGPGTGKSRFMQDIGERAEANGKSVEYFYCSFDPDSLDGIIINNDCAVIDGTAPHVYEPRIPGAVDETVDLSRFWNSDVLKESSRRLRELNGQKSRCFELTYFYLSAIGRIFELNKHSLKKCIKKSTFKEKIHQIIRCDGDMICRAELRIRSAFGKMGTVQFSTYEDIADKVCALSDEYDTLISGELIDLLMREFRREKILRYYSYSPFEKNMPDALILLDKTAITVKDVKGDFDVSEFMDSGFNRIMPMLKENREIKETLLSCAKKQFGLAAEIHGEIEKIYVSAMDFNAKEKFTGEIAEKIIFC